MRTASAHIDERRTTHTVAIRLLERWGVYVRHNRHEFLGYPRRNILHRVQTEGAGASQSTCPIISDVPHEVNFINQQVCVMPELMRRVAECKWRDGMKDKAGSKKIKISCESYRVQKLMIIERVDAVLSSI